MIMQFRTTSLTVLFVVTLTLQCCIDMTFAVPAIVWNKSNPQQQQQQHAVSNEVSLEQVLVMESSSAASSSSSFDFSATNNMNTDNAFTVMFLLERDAKTGQESLTSMMPLLQQTLALQQQQEENQQSHVTPTQYLHVSGIESKSDVFNKIKRISPSLLQSSEPVLVNLNELSYKLNTTTTSLRNNNNNNNKEDPVAVVMDVSGASSISVTAPIMGKTAAKLSKRQRALEESNFFIVTIPSNIDTTVFDTTLVQILQHPSITTVVVTAVRSIDEVKYEREIKMRRQLLEKAILLDPSTSTTTTTTTTSDPYHRRLEQQQNGENNNDNNNNNLSGIYYVQMTPNIFSGLLFFGMFTVVAMIGFSCMNMISGQDVYVTTMPSIGREA